MGDFWFDSAICHDVDDKYTSHDSGTLKDKQWFVKNYCEVCPVKTDCLERATTDDLLFTVRGGLIPGRQFKSNLGRPSSVNKLPNYDELRLDYIARMNGECTKGHILTLDTTHVHKTMGKHVGCCSICLRRHRDNRAVLRRARMATRTHCPKGHELTDDNVIMIKHVATEIPFRKCKACATRSGTIVE